MGSHCIAMVPPFVGLVWGLDCQVFRYVWGWKHGGRLAVWYREYLFTLWGTMRTRGRSLRSTVYGECSLEKGAIPWAACKLPARFVAQ